MGSLAQYGSGFDCASLREVREVRGLATPQIPIIFAHPCKIIDEIGAVQSLDVGTTVIDSPEEVEAVVTAHRTILTEAAVAAVAPAKHAALHVDRARVIVPEAERNNSSYRRRESRKRWSFGQRLSTSR